MNVIKSIAYSQIKRAPRRFIVTALGVIISTAMLTAVFLSYKTVNNILLDFAISRGANYHYFISGEYGDKIDRFVSDTVFKSKLIYTPCKEETSETENQLFTAKMYGDIEAVKLMDVIDGRLPQAEGEAFVNKEHGAKPGDKIKIKSGEGYKEYTVTGIVEKIKRDFVNNKPLAVMYEKPQSVENVTVFCLFTDITKQSSQHANALSQTIFGSDEAYHSVLNNPLLRYYGAEYSADNRPATDGFYSVISVICLIALLIVAAASVIMLYNSFSISTAERRKMLGMLSSIGATPWQKKGFIFYEAWLLGLLGIPLGLLCGYAGLGVTIKMLNATFASVFGSKAANFGVNASAADFITSAAVSALILAVSAFIPSVTASKITAIEAVRGTKAVSFKPQSTKGLTRLLFGFEGRLAEINMKRSSRRYAATLLSLTSAVVILISALGPVNLIENSFKIANGDGKYNHSAAIIQKSAGYSPIYMEKYKELLSNASSYTSRKSFHGTIKTPTESVLSDKSLKQLRNNGGMVSENPFVSVIAIPDSEYAAFSGGKSSSDGLRCIVLNSPIISLNGKSMEIVGQTRLKEGDFLLCELNAGTALTLRVDGTVNKRLSGTGASFTSLESLEVIVPQSAADKFIIPNLLPEEEITEEIYGYAADVEAVMDKIVAVAMPQEITRWQSMNSIDNGTKGILLIIKVFTLGFVALIALVSAANISNTVYTGMLLRKRELAMIKSVGLEQSRVNKMVFLESGIYALKALLIGVPVGCVIFLLEHIILQSIVISAVPIPFSSILIAVAGVLAVTAVSAMPAVGAVNKTPIAELLRTEAE